MSINVTGLKDVLRGLNKEVGKIRKGVAKGMVKGGVLILREANRLVPVDLGNLRESGFVVWTGAAAGVGSSPNFRTEDDATPSAVESVSRIKRDHAQILSARRSEVNERGRFIVRLGYTAYYAIFVHEDMQARHRIGQAKFLDAAVQSTRQRVFSVIVSEARAA